VEAAFTVAWAAARADALTPVASVPAVAVLDADVPALADVPVLVAAGAADDELELPAELQAASARRAAARPAPANLLDFT
jgi:hypothetical protein